MSKNHKILTLLLLFWCLSSAVLADGLQDDQVGNNSTEYLLELNERADSLLRENYSDSARVFIDEALLLAADLGDLEGEAYAMRNLGEYFTNRGRPDSIISKIEPHFNKYAGTHYELRIGNSIGTAHSMLGNYHKGLEYFSRMIDLAREKNDQRNMIGITQNLAVSYQSLGDIPAAIESFLNALELAEEIEDREIIAVVLDNLASLNVQQENYDLAEQYLNRAYEINMDMNDLNHQMTNHMSFGGLYRNQEQYLQALYHFDQAIEIAEQLGNSIVQVQAIYNIGLVYKRQENYDSAMDMFRQSLQLSEEQNIPIGFYYNQNGKADVKAALGEYEEAVELYKSALTVAEGAGSSDLISTSLKNIYETFEAMGDTSGAYEYLKRHFALTDSLSRTQRDEALARQEVELGLRAERENRALLEETIRTERVNSIIFRTLLAVILIALITTIFLYQKKKRANELLEKKSTELTEVNEVKDQLLSVLAHDLRAPISNMQGIIYMVQEKLLQKEDLEKALSGVEVQLEQDVNTLTNYLQWAQNQRDGIMAELEPHPVKTLVDDAIQKVSAAAAKKGVNIYNYTDESLQVLADRHMMAVIFRNLLGNAVKYIRADDSIYINAHEKNSIIKISITDTGQGIKPEVQKDLFEPFNRRRMMNNGDIGTGLGLSICKDFALKMGGSLTFESEQGEGTTFTLTLKKPDIKEAVAQTV